MLCHTEQCSYTAAYLQDQSDDVCVLELKETKIRSQAKLISLVCTCFSVLSRHVLVLHGRETPIWMNEQLALVCTSIIIRSTVENAYNTVWSRRVCILMYNLIVPYDDNGKPAEQHNELAQRERFIEGINLI